MLAAALLAAGLHPHSTRAEAAGAMTSLDHLVTRALVYTVAVAPPKDRHVGRGEAGDFELQVAPPGLAICQGEDAVYDVIVASLGGFGGQVTLALDGAPAGTTAAFDPNGAPAPYSSTLTIGNTIGAQPGDYDLEVIGASATTTHTTTAGLAVAAMPGTIALIAPADGARQVSPLPAFAWAADPAATIYTLDIARDAAFANIYITVSGLSEPLYTLDTPLGPGLYYWRVRGENACGPSAAWQTFRFFVGLQHYLPVAARGG
jgi:hypothetical protein